MSSWLEEYLGALEYRDAHEKANEAATNAYTKLADRHAELHKAVAKGSVFPHPDQPDSSVQKLSSQPARLPPSVVGSPAPPPSAPKPGQSEGITSQASVQALREDLAVANRTIHALHASIAALESEISSLTSQSSTTNTKTQGLQERIRRLETERASAARKLRDRESELKEKARLVENVQDEMLGLEMQINVAEEKAAALKRENGELVERWMKRIGDEADKMNVGSGWK